jgi:thiamine-phosphate pyrophosphorylase
MKSFADCTLYGILDLGYVERSDLERVAGEMIAGGIDVIQLRAKQTDPVEIEAIGRMILGLTRNAGIPFVINDHPEIAARIGADAVHVGQDDASMKEVRAIVGESMLIGRSTHSLEQARRAAEAPADYIGFGPLFATPTKPDYEPIGTRQISQVHRELPDLPIFCIGGIKRENLPGLLEAGARRVVIVSGILQADEIASYVRDCQQILQSPHT